jgi:hypothetical protein
MDIHLLKVRPNYRYGTPQEHKNKQNGNLNHFARLDIAGFLQEFYHLDEKQASQRYLRVQVHFRNKGIP